ncbi:MAG: hypothetical protein LBT48_08860 [Prevotellaceae bacterium]|nr:hypothetical protein [Prevotellaceae bacterium]
MYTSAITSTAGMATSTPAANHSGHFANRWRDSFYNENLQQFIHIFI